MKYVHDTSAQTAYAVTTASSQHHMQQQQCDAEDINHPFCPLLWQLNNVHVEPQLQCSDYTDAGIKIVCCQLQQPGQTAKRSTPSQEHWYSDTPAKPIVPVIIKV